MLNSVILGDCLEVMKEIEDKSIDLVCIDPPYNIGKAAWDKIDNYIEWMGLVFKELERVLKDNGSFYFWHNDFLQIVELQNWLNKNSEFIFKQMIVWDKYNGSKWSQLNAVVHSDQNRNYSKQAEYCLFYTFQEEKNNDVKMFSSIKQYLREEKKKSGLTLLEINKLFGINISDGIAKRYFGVSQWELPTEEKYKIMQSVGFWQLPYGELKEKYEEERYTFNNQGIPSVWVHPYEKTNGHITPKPIKLIENIIKTSSKENGIILDCFGGSGTTAIAAINTNRNYILIEKEKEYFDIINNRIAEHQQQLELV